jgi:hypothetical protein
MNFSNTPYGKYSFPIFGNETTHSNGTTTSRMFEAPYHMGMLVFMDRISDTGTTTHDLQLQFRNPGKWGGTGDDGWANYLDSAGNVVSMVQFADGATGLRWFELHPKLIGGDADGIITFGTNFRRYNAICPYQFRFASVVATGTSTFAAQLVLLP